MVEQHTPLNTTKYNPSPVAVVLGLAAWSVGGFFAASYLMRWVLELLVAAGVDFSGIDITVLGAVLTAISYTVALTIVIGVPWWLFKYRTTRQELALQRLPTWTDLGLAPLAMVAYFITSGLVMYLVSTYISGFDIEQAQNVGFSDLQYRYEYILAFATLVVVAPVAEEVLFRGYLYGKLKKYIPWWAAALVSSVLFGLAHGQWNVAIDTFVLGMFLCVLRDVTDSLWPAIFLHMLKNGIAYYLLFVNPTIINSLGG